MIPATQFNSFTKEKTAILESMLLGAGLHVGANALQKGFRNSQMGHNYEHDQIAKGYQHALEGRQINPVLKNIKTIGIGPESMLHYNIGHKLGTKMSRLPENARSLALNTMRNGVASSRHIQKAPLGNAVVGGIDRILSPKPQGMVGRLMGKVFPTVAAGSKPTIGHRLVSSGIGAATVAAAPHSAIHMGFNAARRGIATSEIGKGFMKSQFLKGVQGATAPSRLRQGLTDMLVSPAALDTRRLGTAIHSEIPKVVRKAAPHLRRLARL
jgi:hypothetical protein